MSALFKTSFNSKLPLKKASPICRNIHVCGLARGTGTVKLVTLLGGLEMMGLFAIGQGGGGGGGVV